MQTQGQHIENKEDAPVSQDIERQSSRNDLNSNIVENLPQGKARDIKGESAKLLKTVRIATFR